MQPLDLDVEDRPRIDLDPQKVADVPAQGFFVRLLHLLKIGEELAVLHQRFQISQSVQIFYPPIADPRADQTAQAGIAQHQPTARRYAVVLAARAAPLAARPPR